ncbi:hypothetical protein OQA88_2387 [Cercophora sp. LCS_1]
MAAQQRSLSPPEPREGPRRPLRTKLPVNEEVALECRCNAEDRIVDSEGYLVGNLANCPVHRHNPGPNRASIKQPSRPLASYEETFAASDRLKESESRDQPSSLSLPKLPRKLPRTTATSETNTIPRTPRNPPTPNKTTASVCRVGNSTFLIDGNEAERIIRKYFPNGGGSLARFSLAQELEQAEKARR